MPDGKSVTFLTGPAAHASRESDRFPARIGISYPDHFGTDGIKYSLEARLALDKDGVKRVLEEAGLPTYLEMADSERWWREQPTSGVYHHIVVASQTPGADAAAVKAEFAALHQVVNVAGMGITEPRIHRLLLEKKALNPLGRRIYNGEDTENGSVKGGYGEDSITVNGTPVPQLLFLTRNASSDNQLTDVLRVTVLPSPAYVAAAQRYYEGRGAQITKYEPKALPSL